MNNSYDFPVTLQPLQTQGGILVPRRMAVMRDDTKTPIGIVSEKYSILPHAEVVNGFREAMKNEKTIEKITITKGGARMHMDVILPNAKVIVDKGDEVAMRFIVENSYDGSKMLQVMFGAFRFVCSNGMVIGTRYANFSRRHIGTQTMIDTQDVITKIGSMTKEFTASAPMMREMTSTPLIPTPYEFFDSKELKIPAYLTTSATTKLITSEAFISGDATVWDAYNALTSAITHDMKKDYPSASLEYSKNAWDASVKLINK